jgi:hypothetical protein
MALRTQPYTRRSRDAGTERDVTAPAAPLSPSAAAADERWQQWRLDNAEGSRRSSRQVAIAFVCALIALVIAATQLLMLR